MNKKKMIKMKDKINKEYANNLLTVKATQLFHKKIQKMMDDDDFQCEEPTKRKSKNKERYYATDDEIKRDLEAIYGNNAFSLKYKIGDHLKGLVNDEMFEGEITKIDSRDITIKTKHGEKMKLEIKQIKNGNINVDKI